MIKKFLDWFYKGPILPNQLTVWTQDFGGEIRLAKVWKDTLTGYHCEKISGCVSMNPDGTLYKGSYVERWGPQNVDDEFRAWMTKK